MTAPSLLILGTDAVLAAVPATPVQLAHACVAAGFQTVIPSSWGDELIAARAAERLRHADGSRLQCSCPYVTQRFARHADGIAPMLLTFVPPPVAVALYLRAVYAPARVHLTFAGDCPGAANEVIDARLSTAQLFSTLAERGIAVASQPTEFDSVLSPDRRRFFSEPGGVPSRHALRQFGETLELVELRGDDVVAELAQQLLAPGRALIDVAVQLRCSCSGVTPDVTDGAVRARVREHEPPRALAPVVDHTFPVPLDAALSASTSFMTTPPRSAQPVSPEPGASPDPGPPVAALEPAARRRSPSTSVRPVLGILPQARADAGRHLPRAYVARRRSSPRGVRRLTQGAPDTATPLPTRVWLLAVGAACLALGVIVGWLVHLL